jgi:hypothetical protein
VQGQSGAAYNNPPKGFSPTQHQTNRPPPWVLCFHCWILMSVCLKTSKLVLVTYVCVGYLCQSLRRMRHVCVGTCVEHLCLWCIFMFVLAIYVCDDICDVYMWYLLFVWMEYKKQIKGAYWSLCRVLHSAKRFFAECKDHSTRQRTKTWAPV